jgi:Terminase large subunit, T4likevirus-type, N-terminal
MKKSQTTLPKSAGSKLPPLDKIEAVLAAEQSRRQNENRLRYYRPYRKQNAFHEAGATFRERLFMAGNQLGKTVAGGSEAAMHLTGRYPECLSGKKLNPMNPL